MSGIDATGFTSKTAAQVLDDLKAAAKTNLGAGVNVEVDSILGVLLGIVADVVGQQWEVMAAIYASTYPDTAVGEALDNVAAITGTPRLAATKSQVTVAVTTDQTVNIAAGAFVGSVSGNSAARFENAEAIVTVGADTVDVLFEAIDTGPTVANAGTLTVIDTPTTGVTGITNAADASVGTDIETDAALRLRREAELSAIGAGTLDTIKARLAQVTGVESSNVFENTSDVTDGDGIPPHAFWPIVYGSPMPAANDVAQALWDVKPIGIESDGASSGTATDAEGVSQTVYYDEATAVPIYIEITITTDADEYPADGDAQVKAALIASRVDAGLGDDVISEAVKAAAFSVPGVLDITAWLIDDVTPPVASANIVIAKDEFAVFDTSQITVTSS